MFDADLTTMSLFDMLDVLWLPCLADLMRVPDPWPDKEGEPEHETEQDGSEQLGHTINAPHVP